MEIHKIMETVELKSKIDKIECFAIWVLSMLLKEEDRISHRK